MFYGAYSFSASKNKLIFFDLGQDYSVNSERNSIAIVHDLTDAADAARRVPLNLTLSEVETAIEQVRPRTSSTKLEAVVNLVYIARRIRLT